MLSIVLSAPSLFWPKPPCLWKVFPLGLTLEHLEPAVVAPLYPWLSLRCLLRVTTHLFDRSASARATEVLKRHHTPSARSRLTQAR
jgi:hypothetical protein